MPLTVRGAPADDERLPGYLLRLAGLNCYSDPSLICSDLKLFTSARPMSHHELGPLASNLGIPPATIHELAYSTSMDGLVQFAGTQLRTVELQWLKAKVCPNCLDERAVAPAVWDLRLWVTCPRHGCEMLSTCQACKRPITWLRSDVAVCRCGAALHDQHSPLAGAVHRDYAYLLAKSAGYTSPAQEGPMFEMLGHLSLPELLGFTTTARSLGIKPMEAKAGTSIHIDMRREAIEHLAVVVEQWPDSAIADLKRRVEGQPYPVIVKLFRRPFTKLMNASNEGTFRFITDAIRSYGQTELARVKPMSGDLDELYNADNGFTPLPRAAARIGVKRSVLKEGIDSGRVPGKAVFIGKRTRWFVTTAWVEATSPFPARVAKRNDDSDLITLPEACSFLGLSHRKQVLRLAWIELLFLERRGAKRQYVSKNSIYELLRLLEGRTVEPSAGLSISARISAPVTIGFADTVCAILRGDFPVFRVFPRKIGLGALATWTSLGWKSLESEEISGSEEWRKYGFHPPAAESEHLFWLSDKQQQSLKFAPTKRWPTGGYVRTISAVTYVLRTRIPWEDLPPQYGLGEAVRRALVKLARRGELDTILASLIDPRSVSTQWRITREDLEANETTRRMIAEGSIQLASWMDG